jgi:NAD(P)-dependent dehydrogenase (short-subunit alcohol dehydrogenase family)
MLVLGATGAVGQETVTRLRAAGATVVAGGRDEAAITALAAATGAEPVVVDVTEGEQVAAAVRGAKERHGRLDGAVLLAGSILLKPVHLTKDEEFEEVLRVNLWSGFWLLKHAVRAMEPEGGSIVLVSTAAASTGLPNHEAIAAAKSGLEGLARSAAATYAPRRIRVNVVAPGLVEAKMSARLFASEAAKQASLAMHPIGRLGRADDVARAVCFFLDPENDWVTGQILGVDGGLAHLKGRGG